MLDRSRTTLCHCLALTLRRPILIGYQAGSDFGYVLNLCDDEGTTIVICRLVQQNIGTIASHLTALAWDPATDETSDRLFRHSTTRAHENIMSLRHGKPSSSLWSLIDKNCLSEFV
jgi:hypothetical protein